MSHRSTLVAAVVALALAGTGVARAERMNVPCSNPQIFRGAGVNLVVLPYAMEEDETDEDVRRFSQQIAHLLGNLSLVGTLPLTSVASTELTNSTGASDCALEAVLPRLRSQLTPGQGLIVVSGNIFMIRETAYLTTRVWFERSDQSEDWRFALLDQPFRAELGARSLTFPVRRLARAQLQQAERSFVGSQFLYASADTASARRPLSSLSDRVGTFSLELGELKDGWLSIRTSESGAGWIPVAGAMEGDSLSASLPELHFLQGLTTYLRFRQGLLGTWPEVPDSILRRGQLLLLSYEQSEDRASRPFASGVAAQMRALMDLLRTRSGEPETVRATDALDAAVDQAPGCAEVIDMEALLELRNQFEASGLDWKPTEVEGLFKRALAADPKNENASNNLSAFYRLVDSTRASRPTPKKFALPADRIQVAQTTIRMINALVRVRSDSSALSRKYDDLGGSGAFLGEPTSEERPTYGRQGRYREYRGGSIYWSPETGAHEVHGVIRDKWRSLGGEGGSLGFPITDETSTPDGIGRYNHFRGGSIYWTPGTGAFEVNGLIGARWAEMGRERSVLGYPVTDETSTSDGVGRFNHFLNGSIYWTPDTGAHEVFGQIRERWKSMGWERSTLGYPTTGVIVAADGLSRYQRFQHGVLHWSPSGEVTESQE